MNNPMEAVERAINQLVDNFIRNQWHHRVENSLRCELFCLLNASEEIPKTIHGSGLATQSIQNEWPEPRPHGARLRRGNFDLVVLRPEDGNWTMEDFRLGMNNVSLSD
jgi:hypothetical protein